jgi:hypothetical protein
MFRVADFGQGLQFPKMVQALKFSVMQKLFPEQLCARPV